MKFFANTRLLLIALTTALCLATHAQDARQIAKGALPSVVLLETWDAMDRPLAIGSGFFVRADIVATNYHVIEGASRVSARVVNAGSSAPVDGILAVDRLNDLALLKISALSGKPLILADVSNIEIGEDVFVLGNPRGLEGSISTGVISGSSLRQIGGAEMIQISAPISPGNSGGPVLNRGGQVVGVAVGSFTSGQNLNFAVPSSYLAILLAKAKSVQAFPGIARIAPPATAKVAPPQPSGQLLKSKEVVFGAFKTYVHPTKTFSIDLPNNWSIEDSSTATETIVKSADPNTNAVVVLHVWRKSGELPGGSTQFLKNFLSATLASLPNYTEGEPKVQKDGSVGIYFKYDQTVDAGTFSMWGDGFIQREGDLVGMLFFLIPNEQYKLKMTSAYKLINSFKLDASAVK